MVYMYIILLFIYDIISMVFLLKPFFKYLSNLLYSQFLYVLICNMINCFVVCLYKKKLWMKECIGCLSVGECNWVYACCCIITMSIIDHFIIPCFSPLPLSHCDSADCLPRALRPGPPTTSFPFPRVYYCYTRGLKLCIYSCLSLCSFLLFYFAISFSMHSLTVTPISKFTRILSFFCYWNSVLWFIWNWVFLLCYHFMKYHLFDFWKFWFIFFL